MAKARETKQCDEYLKTYLDGLASLQKKIYDLVYKESRSSNYSIASETVIAKMLPVYNQISQVMASSEHRTARYVHMAHSMWRDELNNKALPRDKAARVHYSNMVCKLAAALFLNGDLHKSLACIRDLTRLMPRSEMLRIHQIMWTVLCAEWESLNEVLRCARADATPQLKSRAFLDQVIEMTELYVVALDRSTVVETKINNRKEAASLLIGKLDRLMKEYESTFEHIVLLVYGCWLVAVIYRQAEANYIQQCPLAANCLELAVKNTQKLVRTYVPNATLINPYVARNEEDYNKYRVDFEKLTEIPEGLMFGCSWIAWMYELGREWLLEDFHRGVHLTPIRGLVSVSASLLLAVPFRVLQTLNTTMFMINNQNLDDTNRFHPVIKAIYKYISEKDDSYEVGNLEEKMKPLVDADYSYMLSLSRSVSTHSLALQANRTASAFASLPRDSRSRSPSRSPSRAANRIGPSLARAPRRLYGDDVEDLVSQTANLKLASTIAEDASTGRKANKSVKEKKLEKQTEEEGREAQMHSIDCKNCDCNWCEMSTWNYAVAFEYKMAQYLYTDKESDLVAVIDSLDRLRSLSAGDQIRCLPDSLKKAKPRPPSRITDFVCVVLCRFFCRKEYAAWLDRSGGVQSKEKLALALEKISSYNQSHLPYTRLTASQLGRLSLQPLRQGPADLIAPAWEDENVPPNEAALQKSSADNEARNKSIARATSDFERNKNLFLRDWRFLCCSYLARAWMVKDPWKSAFYILEASSISSRALKQQCDHLATFSVNVNKDKQTVVKEENKDREVYPSGVVLQDEKQFQRRITELSENFTLIHLFIADNGVVHLLKLNSARDPVIVPLLHYSRWIEAYADYANIIEKDELISKGKVSETVGNNEKYWAERGTNDALLKTLIPKMEEMLLAGCAPLLMPARPLDAMEMSFAKQFTKASGNRISDNLAKELVNAALPTQKSDKWKKLVTHLLALNGCLTESVYKQMCDVYGRLIVHREEEARQILKGKLSMRQSDIRYTLISCIPELSEFTYEMLPIFEKFPYVLRLASIHSFLWTLPHVESIPRQVSGESGFYILDPDNNLPDSRTRFERFLGDFNWEGMVGKGPEQVDVERAVTQRDLFVYIGHGSGHRHYSKNFLHNTSAIRSSAILAGCSSVRMRPMGIGLDGKSVAHDFARRSCPCVIGTLWTVTDGEIDKFLMKMLQMIFSHEDNLTVEKVAVKRADEESRKRLRIFSESMHRARYFCKLPYLTGAAVICYGVPLVAKPGVHIKTDPEAILKEVNKIRQEEKEKAKQKKLLESEQDKQKENGQSADS